MKQPYLVLREADRPPRTQSALVAPSAITQCLAARDRTQTNLNRLEQNQNTFRSL